MNRSRNHWIAIAAIAAMFMTSVALGIATLGGFARSGPGDVLISSNPVANAVLLLIGIVVLVELERAQASGRRPVRTAPVSTFVPARVDELAA